MDMCPHGGDRGDAITAGPTPVTNGQSWRERFNTPLRA